MPCVSQLPPVPSLTLLLLYGFPVTDIIEAWLEQLTGGMPCDSH
jgi:glycerol uptake facilitator-like aquaporin